MALQKQSININFSKGIDTKSDPNQVALDSFIELENAVFVNGVGLQKRNGFANISTAASNYSNISTYKNRLVLTGTELAELTNGTIDTKGPYQNIAVETQPIIRNSANQSNCDMAMAPNGVTCLTYMEGTTNAFYTVVQQSNGQPLASASFTVKANTQPKVFVLTNYFIVVFTKVVSAADHLRFIAIPIGAPNSPTAEADLSTLAVGAFDAVVVNGQLYFAYADGTNLSIKSLTPQLSITTGTVFAYTETPTTVSMCAQSPYATNDPDIYCFYDAPTSTEIYGLVIKQTFATVLVPTIVTGAYAVLDGFITSGIYSGDTATLFVNNNAAQTVGTGTFSRTGTFSGISLLKRYSRAITRPAYDANGTGYIVVFHPSATQPTYFLLGFDGTTYAKLHYGVSAYNYFFSVSNLMLIGTKFYMPSFYRAQAVPVNRSVFTASAAPIFTLIGLNLSSFSLDADAFSALDLAGVQHLTGGQMWHYDGATPVEHGFNVWPEAVIITPSTSGGLITAQQYFYAFTYEWTDLNGYVHRSAASIPVSVTNTGTTSSNSITVSTNPFTLKSNIRIVGYRWSQAQQNFYQFTSLSAPSLNDPTVNTITILDTLADSAILGNSLLYTTGGVLENIAPNSVKQLIAYRNRLFALDSEVPNQLWYSKVLLNGVPVEMTDAQTYFAVPGSGATDSTAVTALGVLDDKLMLFRENSIYYLNGNGPDATGNNNDYSEPIYVSGTVGTNNPNSVVQTPVGLMFSSPKGIWLLDRGLNASYVGAPVEAYNGVAVVGAVCPPNTNQVRFTLSTGIQLVYDYYVNQWSTFTGTSTKHAIIYNAQQTILRQNGYVQQERTGTYVDGSSPVLLRFTTAWFKLNGLQGFQRAYSIYFLTKWFSPHKLNAQIAYDYLTSSVQETTLVPQVTPNAYGSSAPYGAGPYGAENQIAQYRLYLSRQSCESIRLSITESYDASFGVAPGAGFSASGFQVLIGAKDNKPKLSSKQSFG